MILPLVKVPSPVLNKKAKKVTKFDSKFKKLIKDMSETLISARDPEGVGLAAPQVGVSLAAFITYEKKGSKVKEFINPKILKIEEVSKKNKKEKNDDDEEKTTLEGCLSVDRIWSPIERPQRVLLRYQTLDKKIHEDWFEDFEAVVLQHEVDHLNGKLFTHRALEQQSTIYEEKKGKLHEVELVF